MLAVKYPKPLKKFSTIGLICPASGFDDYKPLASILKYLKAKKYNVKLGKSLINSNSSQSYLSGPDSQRKNDFINFWNDKDIDAIFCLRGGYGTLRLLKIIDFKKIFTSKKIIVGFSDITILLTAIYVKCGLITFHGPMLGYKFLNTKQKPVDKQSEINFWNILHDPLFNFNYSYKDEGIVINGGITEGDLIGGNLTDICSMIGSGYLINFKNKILFLEDCYEKPYKIDRLLTQLLNSDLLDGVKGFIFSSFYNCGFKNNKEIIYLLKEKFLRFNTPIIYNFPAGHSKKNFILPIGKKVVLDTNNVRLYSIKN